MLNKKGPDLKLKIWEKFSNLSTPQKSSMLTRKNTKDTTKGNTKLNNHSVKRRVSM